ncbi:MAG: serine/threonine-protein kinase [Planctomycetota bacterium]|nr:serine/threonine-protein kinase [Planctomycetota bacterium]
MTARNEDFLFAQEAQNLGYVTEEQVEEGFLLQRRMSDDLQIDERLAVILVKRGWMAEEQARRVYGIIEPEGARSRIEGYRLVQKIGRGAMGTVYKAIHKGLHRVVAIKILRRDLATDKTQIERLRREAKLLADLDHPNIVRAFDAGESNGFPYFVMEYVEGQSLRDKIITEGKLSNEEALRVTRALADALEKARRMGIVHRDVKPGNILMGKSGQPKLMDLGLAKGPLDPGLTQHGATVGTPQFMSPEQAESPDKADTRSDIYSLGATLYAMVTGRPPFEGSTLAEIITKVMSQQPVPPRVRNPDVSPEVSHLIERMMLKDASLRYATPDEVIADIDMIRGGQSIIPRGFQGNWEAFLLRKRFLRWRRRIAVGLAAALLLSVGGVLWWKARQRQEARGDLARFEAQVLELPSVAEDHDLEKLTAWLALAQANVKRIDKIEAAHDVVGENGTQVDRRIEAYRRAVSELKRYLAVESSVLEHLRRERYREAQSAAGKGRIGDFDDVPPARKRLRELRARILVQSDAALLEAVRQALASSATTLPRFVSKWRDVAAVYAGNWVDTAAWRDGGKQARAAAAKAEEIGAAVAGFETRYAPAAVGERVEALDLYDLKRDVRADRESTAAALAAHLRAWPDGIETPGLLDENGLATVALAAPERRIDDEVLALWERVRDDALALPSSENRERVLAFENAAARGDYYPDLLADAERLRLKLREEYEARQRQSIALFDETRADVLAALRGGLADALEKRVDQALAATERLSPAMRGRVRGLRIAGTVLREVQDAALAWLAGPGEGQTLRDLAVRGTGGRITRYKQLRVVDVDTSTRTFTARIPRRGTSRREPVSIRIGEVLAHKVLEIAERSGRALPASAAAFADLAALPVVEDEPGRDLRTLRAGYHRVAQEFAGPDLTAWRAYVEDLVRRLDKLQETREDNARLALADADTWFNQGGKHKVALELYERIADDNGKLRYTVAYDDAKAKIDRDCDICREILAQQEMLRLFRGGVDVAEIDGGMHRLTFDFDDLGQLENFERGFAEAQATRRTVTPDESSRSRALMLLPGVRGVLRDRPLSMLTPFDPNEKIVLELRIDTLRGSSLLAFDIDGVQVAICSADPSWWKRRLPDGVPLLEDEESLPAFDYYGLGRGVAFHEGQDFGRSFPGGNWDWSSRSAGRHFERWKDPSYVGRHREQLFAFEPARTYTVRIERLRGQLRLFVDDELILTRRKESWAQRGARSESNRRMRNGSGRIQILTWTPLRIDDLRLEGKISERWKERRRRALAK